VHRKVLRVFSATRTHKVRTTISSLFPWNSSHAAGHKRTPRRSQNRCGSMGPSSEITYPSTQLSSLAQSPCHFNCYCTAFGSELMCPATSCRTWEPWVGTCQEKERQQLQSSSSFPTRDRAGFIYLAQTEHHDRLPGGQKDPEPRNAPEVKQFTHQRLATHLLPKSI